MSRSAYEVAEAAAGNIDVEQLTDQNLLRRASVLDHLDTYEQLEYLFISHDGGMTAAKLLHTSAPRDFSAGDAVERTPGRRYAAVLAITSRRVLFIIGKVKEDQRTVIPLEEITAARRETINNTPSIAFRNDTLKFTFTPDQPGDIDAAVEYLNGNRDTGSAPDAAEDTESAPDTSGSTSTPSHKYSVNTPSASAATERQDESPTDAERPDKPSEAVTSGDTSATRETATSTAEPTTAPTEPDEETDERENGTERAPTSVEPDAAAEPARQADTTTNGDRPSAKPEERTTHSSEVPDDTESADTRPAGLEALPREVANHVDTTRAFFEGIDDLFASPEETYRTAVAAHTELCQALDALPAGDYPDQREEIAARIRDIEVLIESLSEYRSVLADAQMLRGETSADETTTGAPRAPEAIQDELEALRAELAETAIDTSSIETLIQQLPHTDNQHEESAHTDDDADAAADTQETSQAEGEGDDEETETTETDETADVTQQAGEAERQTVEEQFAAATDATAAVAESMASPTVILQLDNRYSGSDERSVFTAVDADDNQLWLVAHDVDGVSLVEGEYYRLENVEIEPASGRESHRVIATSDSSIRQLSAGIDTDTAAPSHPSKAHDEEEQDEATHDEAVPDEKESETPDGPETADGSKSTTDDQEATTDDPAGIGDQCDSDDSETLDGTDEQTQPVRIERVVHHLFVTDSDAIDSDVWTQLLETTEKIHTLDIREATFMQVLPALTTIETELKDINPGADGVDSARLVNVTTRVIQYLSVFDELKDILIEARRKLTLAENDRTPSVHDVREVSEQLETAISLSKGLHRNQGEFKRLKQQADATLEGLQPPEPDDGVEDGTEPPTDPESDIQANELAEYYETIRNLNHLTSAIRTAVDDLDPAMRQWCDAVEAFYVGEMEGYPSYGELQANENDFAMSAYRDVYGNDDRVTQFHVIDVESVTETVQYLLETGAGLDSLDEVYLPVGPESGTRLPVIVETEAEAERALDLLKELPTEPSSAADIDKAQESEVAVDADDAAGSDDDDAADSDVAGDDDDGSDETVEGDEAPLTELGGVTESVAAALRDAGITSRDDLAQTDLQTLSELDGLNSGIAQRIKMQTG